MNSVWQRLGLTVAVALGLTVLSGVDVQPHSLFDRESSIFDPVTPPRSLSMMSVGIAPMVGGFLLVEVLAFLVPAWRRRRVAGPTARRPLRVAGWVATGAFALLQLRTQALRGDSLDADSMRIVGLLALGAGLSWLGFEAVERWGLGSGYGAASLLTLEFLGQLKDLGRSVEYEQLTPGAVLIAGAVSVGGAAFLVTRTRRPATAGDPQMVAPVPISGLGMTASAGAIMSSPALLAGFFPGLEHLARRLQQSQIVYLSLFTFITIALTVLWGVLFFRPRLVAAAWKQWNPSIDETSAVLWARSLLPVALRDALIVNALSLSLLPEIRLAVVFPALLLTLAVLDVVDEFRFRRQHGALGRVWELHRVYEIDALLRRLEAEGLHPFARSRRLRASFQVFGPYVPVSIFVPLSEVARAKEIVGE